MVKLGQNFLVDRNILGVIERLAALSEDDVVLEVGGGPGVLSQRLAAHVAFVHVVELDRSLESNLRALLEPYSNVALHMGDALDLDLSTLEPAPNKMVANLPYGVAATVILRTVAELPSIQSWVVMGQREVGERFAAKPGTDAYGGAISARAAGVRCEGAAAGESAGLPARAECGFGAVGPQPQGGPAGQPCGGKACP